MEAARCQREGKASFHDAFTHLLQRQQVDMKRVCGQRQYGLVQVILLTILSPLRES
jgi:hypothetical protein